jgi:hypothetical protein
MQKPYGRSDISMLANPCLRHSKLTARVVISGDSLCGETIVCKLSNGRVFNLFNEKADFDKMRERMGELMARAVIYIQKRTVFTSIGFTNENEASTATDKHIGSSNRKKVT